MLCFTCRTWGQLLGKVTVDKMVDAIYFPHNVVDRTAEYWDYESILFQHGALVIFLPIEVKWKYALCFSCKGVSYSALFCNFSFIPNSIDTLLLWISSLLILHAILLSYPWEEARQLCVDIGILGLLLYITSPWGCCYSKKGAPFYVAQDSFNVKFIWSVVCTEMRFSWTNVLREWLLLPHHNRRPRVTRVETWWLKIGFSTHSSCKYKFYV